MTDLYTIKPIEWKENKHPYYCVEAYTPFGWLEVTPHGWNLNGYFHGECKSIAEGQRLAEEWYYHNVRKFLNKLENE